MSDTVPLISEREIPEKKNRNFNSHDEKWKQLDMTACLPFACLYCCFMFYFLAYFFLYMSVLCFMFYFVCFCSFYIVRKYN